jgi:hypothetical protein
MEPKKLEMPSMKFTPDPLQGLTYLHINPPRCVCRGCGAPAVVFILQGPLSLGICPQHFEELRETCKVEGVKFTAGRNDSPKYPQITCPMGLVARPTDDGWVEEKESTPIGKGSKGSKSVPLSPKEKAEVLDSIE